ncbi:MAG: hypothetical protein IKD31_04665 [Clostridia bacterium]|nr:hypothetical protein [Clostridia bacterium]
MYGSRLKVKRFENRITRYESMPMVKGKILFYGHSLFTRCSVITSFKENPVLEEEVRMKDGSQAIVNHGFGTSSADDLLYYYDRMVRAYEPRALVVATFGNDLGFGYSAKEVMEILARVVNWTQADFPGIPVYCFGAVPTLKRKGEKSMATRHRAEFNEILEDFCAKTENCHFVSLVDQPFFFENPEDAGDYDLIREDIFASDGVHLNPRGYAMFMDFIRELLDDLL